MKKLSLDYLAHILVLFQSLQDSTYCWFAINLLGCGAVADNNVNHPRRLDPTMELTYFFALYLQHGRHDVKCKQSIQLSRVFLCNLSSFGNSSYYIDIIQSFAYITESLILMKKTKFDLLMIHWREVPAVQLGFNLSSAIIML